MSWRRLLCLVDLSDRFLDLIRREISYRLDGYTLHRYEEHHRDATDAKDLR